MELHNTQKNINTQPLSTHRVFNNWNVVAKGWYLVCESKKLKVSSVNSFNINGQSIAIFRDGHGKVHAMDGYCAHMGVDLGIGKVINNNLRCFFHHWQYDKNGDCVHIPAQKEIPKKACLKGYRTSEKYGHIWVYPSKNGPDDVLEIPALEGVDIVSRAGKSYKRKCHYHITMINGIDPQHLSTVHGINIKMDINIKEDTSNRIDIELRGEVPATNIKEKIWKYVLGNNYAYSMKYADGTLAALTTMKDVKLFNKFKIIPELYMLFAYKSDGLQNTIVNTIFVTKKRKGLFGPLKSHFILWITSQLLKVLQGEDGEVYENIRFKTDCLLPIDAPVAKYIKYINGLAVSKWSRDTKHYQK